MTTVTKISARSPKFLLDTRKYENKKKHFSENISCSICSLARNCSFDDRVKIFLSKNKKFFVQGPKTIENYNFYFHFSSKVSNGCVECSGLNSVANLLPEADKFFAHCLIMFEKLWFLFLFFFQKVTDAKIDVLSTQLKSSLHRAGCFCSVFKNDWKKKSILSEKKFSLNMPLGTRSKQFWRTPRETFNKRPESFSLNVKKRQKKFLRSNLYAGTVPLETYNAVLATLLQSIRQKAKTFRSMSQKTYK